MKHVLRGFIMADRHQEIGERLQARCAARLKFKFWLYRIQKGIWVGICRKNTRQTDSKNDAINGFSRMHACQDWLSFLFFPHIGEALRREENLRDGSIEALLADNERQEAAIELHTHTLTHEKIAGFH